MSITLNEFRQEVATAMQATKLPRNQAARLARLIYNLNQAIRTPPKPQHANLAYNLEEFKKLMYEKTVSI